MIKNMLGSLMLITLLCTQVMAATIIDYSAVNQFDSLTDAQVQRAAQVKILLRHASVGQCLNSGLDALSETDGQCDRANFVFQSRGNPGWRAKIEDLNDQVIEQLSDFDVFSQKFCYIDSGASAAAYILAMESLQTSHRDKVFVWWTMPLTASGDARAQAFNKKVRAYAKAHNKILFDIASIESHYSGGSSCLKKGVESLCPEYTDDGGHPNQAGSLRIAQAYWVLAYRLAELTD